MKNFRLYQHLSYPILDRIPSLLTPKLAEIDNLHLPQGLSTDPHIDT